MTECAACHVNRNGDPIVAAAPDHRRGVRGGHRQPARRPHGRHDQRLQRQRRRERGRLLRDHGPAGRPLRRDPGLRQHAQDRQPRRRGARHADRVFSGGVPVLLRRPEQQRRRRSGRDDRVQRLDGAPPARGVRLPVRAEGPGRLRAQRQVPDRDPLRRDRGHQLGPARCRASRTSSATTAATSTPRPRSTGTGTRTRTTSSTRPARAATRPRASSSAPSTASTRRSRRRSRAG